MCAVPPIIRVPVQIAGTSKRAMTGPAVVKWTPLKSYDCDSGLRYSLRACERGRR